MIVLDLSILNQKGTPMFNSDLTANRPAAGIVGRIFIAIDSPYGIFRDTGTSWDQISSAGGADTNIYNTDGTLTGTRTVSSGGFQLVFNPQTTFFSSLTASTGASSFSVLGSNALTFAAGFSSSNIGNVYGANGAINAQNFIGNATFAQANLASAMVNVNKIDFGSGGHTITMTQSTAPGIRAMTGVQNQIQFTGSHNGTISHAAVSQNLGFFRESGSTRTLTITNAYSHLINPLDDYGAGFTFTNRWGIYQAGPSDKNYFAANVLIGTAVDNGNRLQVSGDTTLSGNLTLSATGTTSFTISSAGSFSHDAVGTSNQLLFTANGNYRTKFSGAGFGTIFGATSASQTTSNTILIQTRVDRNNNIFQFNTTPEYTGAANVSTISLNGIVAFDALNNIVGAIHTGIKIIENFAPNSTIRDIIYNNISIQSTINQTGGAVQTTRGLYINPTLTAAADWRAIEISAGVSILAPSSTASASLRVPSGTAPTTPTNGDIWFDGTNLFMRIGGLTKTFTII
jgi:hypothetical protein